MQQLLSPSQQCSARMHHICLHPRNCKRLEAEIHACTHGVHAPGPSLPGDVFCDGRHHACVHAHACTQLARRRACMRYVHMRTWNAACPATCMHALCAHTYLENSLPGDVFGDGGRQQRLVRAVGGQVQHGVCATCMGGDGDWKGSPTASCLLLSPLHTNHP